MRSSSVALAPSRSTTKACGVSPHFSSGRPTMATSCTAGWRSSTPSTSTEEMFSPPLMITSLSRSRVSSVEPAVPHGPFGGLGVLVVALHDDIAPDHDLAHGLRVGGHLAPVGVH